MSMFNKSTPENRLDEYTYQVIFGQSREGNVMAVNPQDALTKVARKYNYKILAFNKGDETNYNAATNLIRSADGSAPSKVSRTYYNIEVKKNVDIPVILIQKQTGKEKACFRATHGVQVPEFLSGAVRIVGNEVLLEALEGREHINLAERPVIAYEKVDAEKAQGTGLLPNANGEYWNAWWKRNASTTLIERDGHFYEIPKPVQAQLVTENFPKFLGVEEGGMIRRNDDGYDYLVSWNPEPMHTKNYQSFWVKYGDKDFNALQVGTPSAADYIVVNEQGKKLGTLEEYYTYIMNLLNQ